MSSSERGSERGAPDIASIVARIHRPKRAVVTAGMPYANGQVHLGHLAGAQVPGDIHARWMGMVIGRPNVLYVCGTDEHGSTSELAALQAGVPIRELLERVHDQQAQTLRRYSIGLDVYTGTARPECFPLHRDLCQDFLRRLYRNGMLEKRTSRQWFDPKIERFLPDRFVRGKCPNPKCDNESAYSDECDQCGHQHDPTELIEPRSALSDATPVMRDTQHWYLDMWTVAETLRVWIESKSGSWRQSVLNEVLGRVLPALRLPGDREAAYKEMRQALPAAQDEVLGRQEHRRPVQDPTRPGDRRRRAGRRGDPDHARRRLGAPLDHARRQLGHPPARRPRPRAWPARRSTSGPTR